MKIYESQHTIKNRDKKNFLDIPVSLIEKNYYPEKISITFNPDFTMNKKKAIVPYQEFSSSNFLAFDKDKNKKAIELRYDNNKYTYLPDHEEFIPDNFSVKLFLKRKNIFSNLYIYDLNVGITNTEKGVNRAEKLALLFNNASYYNAGPPNVIVNSKNLDVNAFVKNEYDNLDFLFIEGYDNNNLTLENLNYENLFHSPKTIWVLLDESEALRYFVKTEQEYETLFNESLQLPYISKQIIDVNNYNYRAAVNNNISSLDNLNYNNITKEIFTSSLYAPFIVYEKLNSGFIIISSSKILDNPRGNYQIIYNTLMASYLKGYKLSKTLNSWITDEPIMRIGTPYNVYNHAQEPIALADFFDKNDKSYYYDIEDIIIDNDNVEYSETVNGQLYFKKINKTDPEVPFGYISMKTHKKSVIIFKEDNDYNLIEPEVKIQTQIENNKCYITVYPFVSSSKQIIINNIYTYQIKDIYKKWYLIALPIQDNNESDMLLMSEDDYGENELKDFTIAEISVIFAGETIISDIRTKGGGLPLNYTNYDMIDIGNLKGKPYRVGVGGIIKLPSKYKIYDEKIRKAIATYKVAADRFYIIYED